MRQEFDESFAVAVDSAPLDLEDFLLIRVAGNPYAVRLRDIAGIVGKHVVVPLPTSDRSLLGLAGIRGSIVPVFDFGSLLGYALSPDTAGWMVLSGGTDPIALAFREFEGFVQLAVTAICQNESLEIGNEFSTEIARTDSGSRPVININRILAALKVRNSHKRPTQE
jgi:purine-binding chemotaxis protein CheW